MFLLQNSPENFTKFQISSYKICNFLLKNSQNSNFTKQHQKEVNKFKLHLKESFLIKCGKLKLNKNIYNYLLEVLDRLFS